MKKFNLFLLCLGFFLNGNSQTLEGSFTAAYGNNVLTGKYVLQSKKRQQTEYLFGCGIFVPTTEKTNVKAYARNIFPMTAIQFFVPEIESRRYFKKISNAERFKVFGYFEQRFSRTNGLIVNRLGYNSYWNRIEYLQSLTRWRITTIENAIGIGVKLQVSSNLDFISKIGGCLALNWVQDGKDDRLFIYDPYYNFSFGLRYRFN